MKIFICCSKAFYGQIPPIQKVLEEAGHTITLPNSFANPGKESAMHALGTKQHAQWKAEMIRLQATKVQANDAILVLNFEKNGQQHYIGGATFLEMYMAFDAHKQLYLYNPIPEGMLRDEILSFEPVVINQDLSQIPT